MKYPSFLKKSIFQFALLLQDRPWGLGNDILLPNGPTLVLRGVHPSPRTRFALPASRERHLSMPETDEKERDYLFKELYKLKNNDLMSSLRSQSPLEYPQTHNPPFPSLPSPRCSISEKEIEVCGSSLPKPHGSKETPHGCGGWD